MIIQQYNWIIELDYRLIQFRKKNIATGIVPIEVFMRMQIQHQNCSCQYTGGGSRLQVEVDYTESRT
jgi:hypothetical protein